MADSPTPNATTEPNSGTPELGKQAPQSNSNQPDPSPPSSSSAPSSSVPANPNPTTPLPPPIISQSQPPSIPTIPPSAPPSFRPVAPPVPGPAAPQFSPLLNPNLQSLNYQNPNVQPPGVSPVTVTISGAASGGVTAAMSVPPMMAAYAPLGQHPNPDLRPYMPMPNGFPTMAVPAPQGMIPPSGIARYPSPYPTIVRPVFPPRPLGAIGIIPPLLRLPVPGIRGPIIPPIVRPVVPSVTPTEKPQTTVYVGKIASTVENDFMLSLLQLCGPVKNWKRAQDPSNGTPKGFGFCEFDSAESVLRALRLLSKLNVDGQELVLNVNQATREFLERYVEKKIENLNKLKESGIEGGEKGNESVPGAENSEPLKPSTEEGTNKVDKDSENKENQDIANFGTVTDEDREADREALEKLTSMLEERLKTKPRLPATDALGNSNSELPATSRERDSDVDVMKNDATEARNDEEMTSESKPTSEHDRPETSSPDRSRRNDRRSRDREREEKREKERELERYEREREQERAIREREREVKIRDDERRYRWLVKDWESRERDKERLRKLEKEREKEKLYKRRQEIMDQEYESDDGDNTKRRKHKSSGSEERRKRLREKEEDLDDRLKEEEEIAEVRRRADEEQQEQGKQEHNALKLLSDHVNNGSADASFPDETNVARKDKAVEQTSDSDSGHGNHIGDGIVQNGNGDESGLIAMSDPRQISTAPARKLGFGLVGSGKRTAVPSVFHEEEDEDAQKEKKMRPLVPIDYSTEELQAVQPTASGAPSPNLVAAAEFAKRISNVTPKEEKPDREKERNRRSNDRSHQRDREWNDRETSSRSRDEIKKETSDRDRDREYGPDKVNRSDNQKLLDAKQLIDMIPKTKEELFSYEINWAVYDKNELHERMRPWISKKITEFLGEEEPSLVDFIVSTTREHVKASEMLERMQLILDDEAEMFVLKMWRMLIFEIKKIETGLALRSKT